MTTDITPLLLNILVFSWITILIMILCLWHIYFSNNVKIYKNMMYGYPIILVISIVISLFISFIF
jgi:hypothetical protein